MTMKYCIFQSSGLCLTLLLASGLVAGCDADDAETDVTDDASDSGSPDADDAVEDGETEETDTTVEVTEISFGAAGSPASAEGAGSFTFGAATAAAQIEEGHVDSDWWVWSQRVEDGGLGKGLDAVGDGARGYSNALADIAIVEAMNLDAYRFSIDWARVEPQRDVINNAALAHYDDFIDGLEAAGVDPMITVHHFSNPIWADDPRNDDTCANGISDVDLCGWGHEEGGAALIEEMAEHAALLAQRYGDRVDDWCTINEPINYIVASYGAAVFPPGRTFLLGDFPRFVRVIENIIGAHAAIYDAIKANDTIDADGDGVAANVGYTLSIADWVPARNGQISDHPADLAAHDRVEYVYHYLFTESLRNGSFDADLDGVGEIEHPEWEDRLDWMGVQYYFRAGVNGNISIIPGVDADVCTTGFGVASCLRVEDETKWVPEMGYEYYEPGIYNVIMDFAERWPDLPLTVTEAGIATNVGARRAENVVRTLEQIDRAIQEGADVRGYYHWSLIDNFEWAEGYGPRFGLYSVDFDGDYARTPTEGATVLADIAANRRVSVEQRETYGGLGPMTPEEE